MISREWTGCTRCGNANVAPLQRDCTKLEEQNSVTIMNGPLNSYTYSMRPLMSAALVPCTIIVYSSRYRTSSTTDRAISTILDPLFLWNLHPVPVSRNLLTKLSLRVMRFFGEYFRYNLLTFEKNKILIFFLLRIFTYLEFSEFEILRIIAG